MGVFRRLLAILGGMTVAAIAIVIGLFYLTAFTEGAEAWFGWRGAWVAAAGGVLGLVTGPLGMLVLAVVGGYGAYYSWGWHWLVCLLVFFPAIPLIVGLMLRSALLALFRRSKRI